MIQKFEFKETSIKGLYEITPFNADDIRGCFTKDYSKEIFEQNGIQHDLAEVFYTTSYKGVIRALHFQREKQQPKLVRCIYGHVFDVVVDLRKNSPTFKKWLGFDLVGSKHNEILVPAGCGHGYLVLEESIVSYKCAEKFYGEYDDGILWDDEDINVHWPLDKIGGIEKVILADKDKNLQTFKTFIKKYKPILLVCIYHSADDFFNIKPLIESFGMDYKFQVYKPINNAIVTETILIAK